MSVELIVSDNKAQPERQIVIGVGASRVPSGPHLEARAAAPEAVR